MTKKLKTKKEGKQPKREQSASKVSAGHYTPSMVDLLGYEIIENAYESTILAIEDAQKFSDEVRTKGLQCAALLITLLVGIITGICTIRLLFAKVVMLIFAAVFVSALRDMVNGIIYRKENATRGNTQSFMLCQQMIDTLEQVEEDKRTAFFLASRLKGMEKEAKRLNTQTDEMQNCFEKTTRKVLMLTTWILVLSFGFAILFYHCLPVY